MEIDTNMPFMCDYPFCTITNHVYICQLKAYLYRTPQVVIVYVLNQTVVCGVDTTSHKILMQIYAGLCMGKRVRVRLIKG